MGWLRDETPRTKISAMITPGRNRMGEQEPAVLATETGMVEREVRRRVFYESSQGSTRVVDRDSCTFISSVWPWF